MLGMASRTRAMTSGYARLRSVTLGYIKSVTVQTRMIVTLKPIVYHRLRWLRFFYIPPTPGIVFFKVTVQCEKKKKFHAYL